MSLEPCLNDKIASTGEHTIGSSCWLNEILTMEGILEISEKFLLFYYKMFCEIIIFPNFFTNINGLKHIS